VPDADRKSLVALSDEIDQLTRRAVAGQLPSPAFAGATFTLSNVGQYGVASSTILVEPPQAAAVAAGAIRTAALIRDGVPVAGHAMTLTLACDHRILYGAEAARFLNAIGSRLEQASL
jgi:pyruvate dehydrogenase E2 component (dihydrolipoyllysine-residue acetyltransferase)